VYTTVNKRVGAGRASKLEEIKARVELSKTRLDSINAEKQLLISEQSLATLWGDSEITFTDVVGDITRTTPPPDLNSIVNNISNNPDMARWVSEISRQQSSINLARAQTIPDVTVSAGMRHLNASDDIAAVASISIPLFIFNNKQTGVQRSKAGLRRAIKQRETSELKIRSSLIQNYQQLKILYGEVSVLKEELLPAAEEVFVASKKIYQLGKLDLLGLLDAQRTYFDVRKQYIESITAYQLMVITIERLIGSGLETFQ
jgi:cobalt-zinc-cadmium efflux system outer membrane protein